jgi:hypothetical protein
MGSLFHHERILNRFEPARLDDSVALWMRSSSCKKRFNSLTKSGPHSLVELIQSLEGEVDADAEAAWSAEIRARLDRVDAGTATTIPWSEARRRIHAAAGRDPRPWIPRRSVRGTRTNRALVCEAQHNRRCSVQQRNRCCRSRAQPPQQAAACERLFAALGAAAWVPMAPFHRLVAPEH